MQEKYICIRQESVSICWARWGGGARYLRALVKVSLASTAVARSGLSSPRMRILLSCA